MSRNTRRSNPNRYERLVHSLDKTQLAFDYRATEVTLAQIPFVSQPHGLPGELLQEQASFSTVVATARLSLEPPLRGQSP